ncbi:hypothetical protein AUK22_09890 [bacterium CG2_30_54_10]|nr:MAG: hypothetical protein AUK22_09890 [bacterium CG2_30_54_10]
MESRTPPQLPGLLRKFLTRKKYRPAELSRQSGVPKPSISNILSGKRGAASETLAAFSKALGLSSGEAIEMFLASVQDSAKGDVRKVWEEVSNVVIGAAQSPALHSRGAVKGSPAAGSIPIFSSVEAKLKKGKISGEQIGEFPFHAENSQAGAFAVLVSGDAMNGPDSWIRNADVAVFNPISESAVKDNDVICLFVQGWKEFAIRRIQKDPRGILFLLPDNPSFPKIEVNPSKTPLTVFGKLAGSWRGQ